MNLFLDFETWSSVNIRRGTDVYLNNARPLLLTYALDDGPVELIDFTAGTEAIHLGDFLDLALDRSYTLIAHNVFFDRGCLQRLLGFETDISRWHCTQAHALAHSLPGGLDPLCQVLQVPIEQAKIQDGMRLIRKFCGPKPFVKDEEWPLFIKYAINDITAMRECYKRMPNWNYKGEEKHVWEIDQVINNRGFCVDTQLARQAVAALAKEKGRLDDATWIATAGSVSAATQRDKLLTYLCESAGCYLADLRAPTIQAALEDESIPESTKELLRLRLQASKTSTSKYKRMLDSVGPDNRLRGTLQYSGANRTARWAGRIFQPQNLPRPTLKPEAIRDCIGLIREGRADLTTLFAPSVNEACSNALRGLIVADEGKKLIVADWSAIEGRVNAWLAGEGWKIKAFREGQDLYKLIYSKAFGIDVSAVTKGQRQIGKVQELALGYGGGVGAFLSMAAGYGMDLEELGRTVTPVEKALEAWERAVKENMTFGLSKEVYVACDTLKIGYRKANPAIEQSWYQYEGAVRKVIEARDPKLKVQIGHLMFDCNGHWLRIKLPSGRFLSYAEPRIHVKGNEISYMGWRNKQWHRTKTYGGKLCENIVQAVSRDLLAAGIVQAEERGMPVSLHVHDEIVVEVPEASEYNLADLTEIMTTAPRWAQGLPLSAEGFESMRYEK